MKPPRKRHQSARKQGPHRPQGQDDRGTQATKPPRKSNLKSGGGSFKQQKGSRSPSPAPPSVSASPTPSSPPPPAPVSGELFEREPIARPNRTPSAGAGQSNLNGAAQLGAQSSTIISELRDELSNADSPLEAIWVLLMRMQPATLKLVLADLGLPPAGADHEELVKRLVRVLQ